MSAENKKGFTLIELLLVIALILVVGFFSSGFYVRFIDQMAVQDAKEGLIGALSEARSAALAGKYNASWGVKKNSGEIVIFRGDSYANRNLDFDQVLKVNSNVTVSGFDEEVFSPGGGFPVKTLPDVVVSLGTASESFSLNSEGAIE